MALSKLHEVPLEAAARACTGQEGRGGPIVNPRDSSPSRRDGGRGDRLARPGNRCSSGSPARERGAREEFHGMAGRFVLGSGEDGDAGPGRADLPSPAPPHAARGPTRGWLAIRAALPRRGPPGGILSAGNAYVESLRRTAPLRLDRSRASPPPRPGQRTPTPAPPRAPVSGRPCFRRGRTKLVSQGEVCTPPRCLC